MCHQPLTLIRPAATFSLREKKSDRPRLAKQGYPAGLLETFRFGHSLLDIHHSAQATSTSNTQQGMSKDE